MAGRTPSLAFSCISMGVLHVKQSQRGGWRRIVRARKRSGRVPGFVPEKPNTFLLSDGAPP